MTPSTPPQGDQQVYRLALAGGQTSLFTGDHLFVVKVDSPESPALNMRLAEIANAMNQGRTILLPVL